MGRKKAFELKPKSDPIINKIRKIDINNIADKRIDEEKEVHDAVYQIVSTAQNLIDQGRIDKSSLKNYGLYTIEEAYREVKRNRIPISFRAFGGRIERKSIYSTKIGRKRYIPEPVLKDWVALHKKYYTVREAYEKVRKNLNINLRAFIGRIEKNSVPSIKIGTQRWVPKEYIDSLTYIAQNYYDVSTALKQLRKNSIKLKRNAFERRLDRKRIPHVKIGGRRFIHKDVLNQLIKIEKNRLRK
ncbi:hypothetical protein J7J90_04625 [Candidatus Micrarchaeota archaeon]|nr:hypothetical protein [Candidatus Micrarchaeota archaeon]